MPQNAVGLIRCFQRAFLSKVSDLLERTTPPPLPGPKVAGGWGTALPDWWGGGGQLQAPPHGCMWLLSLPLPERGVRLTPAPPDTPCFTHSSDNLHHHVPIPYKTGQGLYWSPSPGQAAVLEVQNVACGETVCVCVCLEQNLCLTLHKPRTACSLLREQTEMYHYHVTRHIDTYMDRLYNYLLQIN